MIRKPYIFFGTLFCLLILTFPIPDSRSETEYAIGPGDVLIVRVWGHEDLTQEVVVSPEGGFRFPLIGEVKAVGRSTDDVRMIITERLGDGYLVDPQVEVIVKEYKSQKVYVLGEVVRPGAYSLDRRASIVEIISKTGGLGPDAGDVAQIVQGKKDWKGDKPLKPGQEGVGKVIQIDLRGMLAGSVDRGTVEIQDGDTLFVPKAEVFYIFGEVGQPGKYRWERKLTVLKAVITAGGFTDIASKRRIKIRRKGSEEEEKIRAKLDTPVQPGDTIIVPESFF
ncbi:MAG: periplasmic polysaccharide biosynthesis/export protein [Proteobacteria bacterium]|nr:periplasmic polysaccharide biosynthesis/export protein [Pseudomonadota bacterium]